MGRPSLMTTEVFELVLAEKRLGKSDKVAAELAGVSVRSVYRWADGNPALRAELEAARQDGLQAIRNSRRSTAPLRPSFLDARFPQGALA